LKSDKKNKEQGRIKKKNLHPSVSLSVSHDYLFCFSLWFTDHNNMGRPPLAEFCVLPAKATTTKKKQPPRPDFGSHRSVDRFGFESIDFRVARLLLRGVCSSSTAASASASSSSSLTYTS
jgi:hypothetical protein